MFLQELIVYRIYLVRVTRRNIIFSTNFYKNSLLIINKLHNTFCTTSRLILIKIILC